MVFGPAKDRPAVFIERKPMIYRPLRYEQMMRAAEHLDVRARRMSTGMGVFTGEKMFAFLYGEEIGLKLSPEDLNEAMKLPGAGPVQPDPSAEPMREYVKLPKEILDNFDQFRAWVEKSANYARRRMSH
jgi:TfoX/Sxy family transcriptional regulator of competence genes